MYHPIAGLAVSALVLVGCATTVIEDEPATGENLPIESGTIIDADAPEITAPIAGSAAELLPEMATEMSRLGSQIAENDGDDATFARIEELWAAVRPEVEGSRPELLGGLETTVAMSRTAIERNRPADADKAFRLLTDLVDNFTGDG
ncbi:MAG: hypothetical protein QNM02_09565 [Acidimicrobiia bacterium]|nr:hypothetical protein [Acidimicrobiia bacterium]